LEEEGQRGCGQRVPGCPGAADGGISGKEELRKRIAYLLDHWQDPGFCVVVAVGTDTLRHAS
jgi:hypothetical protein